jgi:hypothetical protein
MAPSGIQNSLLHQNRRIKKDGVNVTTGDLRREDIVDKVTDDR